MINEKDLRRYHRLAGIILVVFIIIQALTGTILTLIDIFGSGFYNAIAGNFITFVHFRMGVLGDIYRVILGVGILWLAVSGFIIWNKIRLRNKAK